MVKYYLCVEHKTAKICVEAGGCDHFESVFPWSMSDFKPGDLQ